MYFHENLKQTLLDILKFMIKERILTNKGFEKKRFNIETSSNSDFGDISTNIAMVYWKDSVFDLREFAENIKKKLLENSHIEMVEIKKPGFINIFLKKRFIQNQLRLVKKNKIKKASHKKKINIEYVSANPTGLMHIGHARGAVLGDTLANLLKSVGHNVTKEYYINDAGNQIELLKETILFHKNNKKIKDKDDVPENLYPGQYLKKISENMCKDLFANDNPKNAEELKKNAVNLILKDIKKDLQEIGVFHDIFVSEKKISTDRQVKNIISILKKKKMVYEGFQDKPKGIENKNWIKKKQLLFKSKLLNDDSDRALIKPDGGLTYFMSDIIYHGKKIAKKYDILINIWGKDHSGYVARLENAIKSVFNEDIKFKVKLAALVNLIKDNKVLKMSKRRGTYVPLRDVSKEVGKDALRFMMISRSSDKVLDFDFDLIKSRTKDNPVFYVQYAYARCCSINKIANELFGKKILKKKLDFSLLNLSEEISLIKLLCLFNKNIELAVENFEPNKLTNYLYELSKNFHSYWALGTLSSDKRILIEKNVELSQARLGLVNGVKKIISQGLKILDISAPSSM
tara:strand:- start:60 stop:1778 length:1719 start_codon:yes stop_codon:yes gene_type:complete